MLNTEIREYVSQMSQEELKEVEQIIIESKVKKMIELYSTNAQWDCITTKRNFVVNQFERVTGKTWGIGLEILYNMEDCKIKMNSNECYSNFFKNVLPNLVKYLNCKIGSQAIDICMSTISKDIFYTKLKIGNRIINIHGFNTKNVTVNSLYCDDCLPFSTDEKFKKVCAYITEDRALSLLNQCHKNVFTNTLQEHFEEIKNKDGITCKIPSTKIFNIPSDNQYKLSDGIYCVGKEAEELLMKKLK